MAKGYFISQYIPLHGSKSNLESLGGACKIEKLTLLSRNALSE